MASRCVSSTWIWFDVRSFCSISTLASEIVTDDPMVQKPLTRLASEHQREMFSALCSSSRALLDSMVNTCVSSSVVAHMTSAVRRERIS